MILMEHLPIATSFSSSHMKDTLNIQAITVWTSKEKVIIEPNYQKTVIPTCLHITRRIGTLQQLPSLYDPRREQQYTPHYFSAFLGILNLNSKKIIVLVEKVSLVMSIDERDVFKVVKPVYLFFQSEQRKKLTDEESMMLINLTMILQQGMYFSYAYNLDEPLNKMTDEQEQQHNVFNENKNENDEKKLNFNWANELQKQLKQFNSMWRLALIQGYVDKLQMIINGLKIFLFLISRRCISRSGTLYSTDGRGIDSDGFTANFVETQLILNVNSYFFSYLMHRGNVPVYWYEEQSYGGMNRSVKFFNSIQENNSAFIKHFKLVKQRNAFQYVGIVNLLNQNSSLQKGLISNYEYLVKKNFDRSTICIPFQNSSNININIKQPFNNSNVPEKPLPYLSYPQVPVNINYAYFNIHTQCSKKNYRPLLSFIENDLQKLLHQYEFTVLKIAHKQRKKQVLNTQKGIFRFNCMNCIDRSNIAELSIGGYMIAFMLKHIHIQIPQFQQGISFILNDDSFTNLYRQLWADNADALSKQYTGTGSTQSFAVRKGKLSYLTTIDHGMKSLTRAIKNIRNPDEIKNKAIKLLTGYKELSATNKNQKLIQMKEIKSTDKKANKIVTSQKSHLIDSYQFLKQEKIKEIENLYIHEEEKIKDLQELEKSQLAISRSRIQLQRGQRSKTYT